MAPERKHLSGWQEAESQVEAREEGTFRCPECAAAWSDRQRITMNNLARLVHEGQSIDEQGQITGHIRPTETLGLPLVGLPQPVPRTR